MWISSLLVKAREKFAASDITVRGMRPPHHASAIIVLIRTIGVKIPKYYWDRKARIRSSFIFVFTTYLPNMYNSLMQREIGKLCGKMISDIWFLSHVLKSLNISKSTIR